MIFHPLRRIFKLTWATIRDPIRDLSLEVTSAPEIGEQPCSQGLLIQSRNRMPQASGHSGSLSDIKVSREGTDYVPDSVIITSLIDCMSRHRIAQTCRVVASATQTCVLAWSQAQGQATIFAFKPGEGCVQRVTSQAPCINGSQLVSPADGSSAPGQALSNVSRISGTCLRPY